MIFRLLSLSTLPCLALLAGPARATPAPPLPEAATVVSMVAPVGRRACRSIGTALPVGDGLFLTAAHVLLDAADLARGCRLSPAAIATVAARRDAFPLTVRVGAAPPAAVAVVARGNRVDAPGRSMSFSGSSDWAILRSDAPLRTGPSRAACLDAPQPGQAVRVVLRGDSVATRIAARQSAKGADDGAYIDLDHVFADGTSGAGVLDAATGCVLGVLSHRFPEPTPQVTRMTPVALFADAWRRARGG